MKHVRSCQSSAQSSRFPIPLTRQSKGLCHLFCCLDPSLTSSKNLAHSLTLFPQRTFLKEPSLIHVFKITTHFSIHLWPSGPLLFFHGTNHLPRVHAAHLLIRLLLLALSLHKKVRSARTGIFVSFVDISPVPGKMSHTVSTELVNEFRADKRVQS